MEGKDEKAENSGRAGEIEKGRRIRKDEERRREASTRRRRRDEMRDELVGPLNV